MMGIETIREINRERAEIAAQEGMTPFVYAEVSEVGERRDGSLFPFPFIGDYRPEGWVLAEEHFADSSGLGAEDEPALSPSQLARLIERRIQDHPGVVGWAVIEAGQFQVYVGEFHKVDNA